MAAPSGPTVPGLSLVVLATLAVLVTAADTYVVVSAVQAETYSVAGPGTVALHIGREGDQITLRVTDRGPGFAPEILEAPAQPWNSTSPREGAGLGLFLCRNVARRFGGALTVSNIPSGGAEVVMRLTLPPIAGD